VRDTPPTPWNESRFKLLIKRRSQLERTRPCYLAPLHSETERLSLPKQIVLLLFRCLPSGCRMQPSLGLELSAEFVSPESTSLVDFLFDGNIPDEPERNPSSEDTALKIFSITVLNQR